MYIMSSIRSEKNDGPFEVIWDSPPTSRYTLKNRLRSTFVSAERCCIVSCHVARCYGVDIDIGPGPFIRQCPRQTGYSAFSSCIGRHADSTLKREYRGNIYNPAAIRLLCHSLGCSLRQKEDSLEIHIQDIIPIRFAEVKRCRTTDDTCVIDENIQMPQLIDDLRHCRLEFFRGGAAQIALDAEKSPSEGGDQLLGFGRV